MTERYKPNGRPLTDYEREVLTVLVEECNEVGAAACKLLRFGINDTPPNRELPNTVELGLEIGDALYMMELVEKLGLVSRQFVVEGRMRKPVRFDKYRQTEPPHGTT